MKINYSRHFHGKISLAALLNNIVHDTYSSIILDSNVFVEHDDRILIHRIVGQNISLYVWDILTVNNLIDI